MRHIMIFMTASSRKEAEGISSALLDKKLVACVNIINGATSCFWWKGKKEKTGECLLIAKTARSLFRKVVSAVKKAHSYDIPEIVALPVIEGYKPYLDWIEEEVVA